jgi:hypothetical protein
MAATALAGDAAPLTVADLNKPTTSPAARQQAIESIPVEQLTPAGRAKVNWVLENTSVYRRLPIRVAVCDADLYVFLAQHPDVVVNIWETLGVSHLSMRQTGPDTYQVSDDAGTTGTLQYLLRSRDTQVVYVDGQYTGRVLGHQVRGRGIMVLKSGCVRDVEGRCYVSSRLDAFMNVEPGGAEFLTRTFQPLVGKVADLNFIQTADFLGSLSRTAEVNRRGIQRLVARLDKVAPDVRGQFAQLAEQAAQRASKTSQAEGRVREDVEPTGQSQVNEPLVARRTTIAEAAPVTRATPSPTPTP